METEFNDIGVCGNTHGDTEAFNDTELVEGGKNVRLVRIRVWYDDFVYGIQTIYETANNGMVVSPKRMDPGAEHWNLKYEEISFNRNENIVKLRGHHGGVIDHVIFETNQGREIRFGISDGGEPFELDIPEGTCIGTIRGGYGGHLHNIGGSVIPMSSPIQYQYSYDAMQRVENKISAGPTHDDTQVHSDVEHLEGTKGQHRIKAVTVYYDDSCIYGLSVAYVESGQEIKTKGIGSEFKREDHQTKRFVLAADEWIDNISGSFGDYCDTLTFYTTKGHTEKFGDDREDNFNFEVPEGQVISGLAFGTGGHLHNLTAFFGKEPHIFKFENPPACNTQFSLLTNSSDVIGPTHDDTKPFDDWDKVSSDIINTRIKKVTVYYNEGECVYGFRLEWNVNEEEVEGDKHRGTEYDGWVVNGSKKKFTLKYGEYITRVYGRVGGHIDRLCFEINNGDTHEFGGDGGEEFDCQIPPGHALGGLTGGHNGHLHNIQAWHGIINPAVQSQTAVYYYPKEDRWPNTDFHGNTHGDTEQFVDEGIEFNHSNFRLDTVKLYGTETVKGIICVYEIDGKYEYGKCFMASSVGENDKLDVEMLNMEVDEFITHISGRSGNIIDRLTIRTNKGREISVGSEDNGDEFEMNIPEGNCVGYFSGGKNGDIHNIEVHCGPIPQVMTTHW